MLFNVWHMLLGVIQLALKFIVFRPLYSTIYLAYWELVFPYFRATTVWGLCSSGCQEEQKTLEQGRHLLVWAAQCKVEVHGNKTVERGGDPLMRLWSEACIVPCCCDMQISFMESYLIHFCSVECHCVPHELCAPPQSHTNLMHSF